MQNSDFMDATIEDLIANPHKYGAPSFEEFSKNPDKYRKKFDSVLSSADAGSQKITGIQKHVYYVEGHKCDSIEMAQRMMLDMGIREDQIQMAVNLEDLGNHKIRAHVYFKRKSNLILPGGM